MLVGTPFPVKLSTFGALGREFWIRRVLVRSQEGQSSGGRRADAGAAYVVLGTPFPRQ